MKQREQTEFSTARQRPALDLARMIDGLERSGVLSRCELCGGFMKLEHGRYTCQWGCWQCSGCGAKGRKDETCVCRKPFARPASGSARSIDEP